jgi:oligoendopeptidase F
MTSINTTSTSSPSTTTDNALAKVRFKLSDLYSGIDDPQIAVDLKDYADRTAAIKLKYKGKLAELPTGNDKSNLGSALAELDAAEQVGNKIWCFVLLSYSCNQADDGIKALKSKVEEQFAKASADNLTFLDIEVCKIDQSVLGQLTNIDKRVNFYLPYIEKIRRFDKHNLPEEVERALTLRSPYGPSAVSDYLEEQIAGLEVRIHPRIGVDTSPRVATFEEALSLLSSPDRELRAATLRAVNSILGEKVSPLSALALNLVAGKKSVEDRERSFESPMAARNLSNQISPKVVEALHQAVRNKGSQIARRFYGLLAKQLKLPRLAWSDRNAPIRKTEQKVTWQEAVEIVLAGYRSFSPTLAGLIEKMIGSGRVDGPTYPHKQTGAFSLSVVLPPPLGARSYNLLNFTGTLRDVAVFAHEAGHAVHGILAGQEQGALMSHPPTAYAETASVFGEMITYEGLLTRVNSRDEKLALLMSKLGDFMNTVVRQISFSTFEQKVHLDRRDGKLSEAQLKALWCSTTTEFYGKDGDVFDYKDMDNLWSYIGHFHNPFYVYAYAFGELLTQSLYAERARLGEHFEPLYLELLRAGGTKDAVALLKPFGLNPEDPAFWERGIVSSAERWLDMAEQLASSGTN